MQINNNQCNYYKIRILIVELLNFFCFSIIVFFCITNLTNLQIPTFIKNAFFVTAIITLLTTTTCNTLLRAKATTATAIERFAETSFLTSALVSILLKIFQGIIVINISQFETILYAITVSMGLSSLFSTLKTTKAKKSKVRHAKIYKYSLLAIFCLLVSIKIMIPLFYPGAYIDEFTHIFSAIEFIKNQHFAEIYNGALYNRGALFTYLLAGFFYLFGISLLNAKLFVAFIGIVNFLLFYKLVKKSLTGYITFFLLLVYALSPWIIFEHFYARFYILYETFLLIICNIAISLEKSIDEKNNKRFIKNLFLLFAVNAFAFYFMRDAGRFMLLLFSILIVTYIYIYKLDLFQLSNSFIRPLISLKRSTKIAITAVFAILGVLMIYFLIKVGIIDFDISTISYTAPEGLKYQNFFFNFNLLLTLFFSLACIKSESKIIIFPTALLLLVNILLPSSIQNTRSILYLLPTYYMVSVMGFDQFLRNRSIFIKYAAYFVIIISLFAAYPQNFLSHPYLPKEVDYIDTTIYRDAKNLCNDAEVIVASNPGIAQFFGIQPDHFLNTKINDTEWLTSNPDSLLFKKIDNTKYIDTYSKVNLIHDIVELETNYFENKKICLIQGGLPYSWLDGEARNYIKQNFIEVNSNYESSEDYKRMRLFIKYP